MDAWTHRHNSSLCIHFICFMQNRMYKKLKLSLKGGGTCLKNSLSGTEHLENIKHLENLNMGACKI